MAEDMRRFRKSLPMTSAGAAKRSRISVSRYRALERGEFPRSPRSASELVSVARRLGMETIRVSYADEVGKYIEIDLSTEGRLTVFIDALESDFPGLMDQGHFVTASRVLALVERIGRSSLLNSRKAIDKKIVELWIASLFTVGLRGDRSTTSGR